VWWCLWSKLPNRSGDAYLVLLEMGGGWQCVWWEFGLDRIAVAVDNRLGYDAHGLILVPHGSILVI